jgi:hypothetical protein
MSGVSREDAAAELYGATLRAIEDGTSGGEWQREARGILAAKGITGPDAHAMRLTFRNATASAFQAVGGPLYSALQTVGPSGSTTPSDQATRPLARRPGRPSVRVVGPLLEHVVAPNDHNCRCNVRTMTREQAARRGLKIETAADVYAQRLVVGGQELPLTPAPGWGVNPGLVSFGRGHTRRVWRAWVRSSQSPWVRARRGAHGPRPGRQRDRRWCSATPRASRHRHGGGGSDRRRLRGAARPGRRDAAAAA